MNLKRNNLFNNELQTKHIKTNNSEGLNDPTFNIWKSELEKELPMFWESIEDPIKSSRRFSTSS